MQTTVRDATTGQPACPKCKGGQFVMKRTAKGKMMLGLLAPKRLKCMLCGTPLKMG